MLEQLTSGEASNASPSWSPDGLRIAFYSERDGAGDIYTLDIETGAVECITHDEALDYAPRWSPDGRSIAFVSQRSGQDRIYVTDPDGSEPRLLLDRCAP